MRGKVIKMNELLRFTAPGQNGINILFPPKFEFVFYNDKGADESETYFRQIEVYEMYFDMILQYKNKRIPDIIKEYEPFEFKYNEKDYLAYHPRLG